MNEHMLLSALSPLVLCSENISSIRKARLLSWLAGTLSKTNNHNRISEVMTLEFTYTRFSYGVGMEQIYVELLVNSETFTVYTYPRKNRGPLEE